MNLFGKKFSTKPALLATSQALEPNAPTALMVGSIAGCTAKDADAYARGLAEATLTAPAMAGIRLYFDKPNGRYIYEVHEGGPGLSIIEKALKALASGQPIHIALTNGAQLVIEEAHGEIYSLTYPPAAEELLPDGEGLTDVPGPALPIQRYTDAHKLTPLIQERASLVPLGLTILALASSAFLLSGIGWVAMKSNILESDFLLEQVKQGYVTQSADNPVVHLERARIGAERSAKTLHKLEKTPKGWSHELR